MRPRLGPSFLLKFVRSRASGREEIDPFPKSLVTVKCELNTKMAVNFHKWPLMGDALVQTLIFHSLVFCFSLVFSNQGNSLVFQLFSVVFLCFSRVVTGKKSLVFWVSRKIFQKISQKIKDITFTGFQSISGYLRNLRGRLLSSEKFRKFLPSGFLPLSSFQVVQTVWQNLRERGLPHAEGFSHQVADAGCPIQGVFPCNQNEIKSSSHHPTPVIIIWKGAKGIPRKGIGKRY